MDTTVTSFVDRFNKETLEIMQNLSFLDPRSFPAIPKNGLPKELMEVLTNSLRHFDANITQIDLQNELIDLAKSLDVVKLGRLDGFDYYH